jgi:hypothetical protein
VRMLRVMSCAWILNKFKGDKLLRSLYAGKDR